MPRNVKLHNLFDSRNMKDIADSDVTAGIPILYRVDMLGGPTVTMPVAITEKSRVIDVWVVNRAAGTTSDTITVKNGTDAITNAIDISGADKTVAGVGTIDDAYWEIAAGGTLNVTETDGGGVDSPACTVYVLCHIVA
jgi:hypothetical protein